MSALGLRGDLGLYATLGSYAEMGCRSCQPGSFGTRCSFPVCQRNTSRSETWLNTDPLASSAAEKGMKAIALEQYYAMFVPSTRRFESFVHLMTSPSMWL